ncbi:hypothetical protein GW17_00026375 [Ensete ventricosum]|nr:hypothetical protein GW17_00026375 [Ensete ventricosum]RZS28982.1 hypothetical protein BHM03_00062647 [Ensete ventricosum]
MAGACRGCACGSRQRPQLGRREWLPATRSQVAASWPGLSPSRAAAPIGAAAVQGGTACPRGVARGQQHLAQGRLPTTTACSAAACVGQRRRSEGKGEG